jgi:hypothetical protein
MICLRLYHCSVYLFIQRRLDMVMASFVLATGRSAFDTWTAYYLARRIYGKVKGLHSLVF